MGCCAAYYRRKIKNRPSPDETGPGPFYAKKPAAGPENDGDEFDAIIKKTIEEVERARIIDIENLDIHRLEKMQEKSRKILAALHSLLEQ